MINLRIQSRGQPHKHTTPPIQRTGTLAKQVKQGNDIAHQGNKRAFAIRKKTTILAFLNLLGGILMRIAFMLFALLSFALPAQAGMFTSIEDRGDKITAELQDNNSYHAHLARELASIASIEKGQHDLGAAKELMDVAEEEAAKAGGTK